MVTIPNEWQPLAHQLELVRAFEGGTKRMVACWHRRAGKDSTALNLTATAAMQRVGVYWHMAPTQRQVRKIVWDNIDGQGRRIIDQVWPKEVRTKANDQEMKIELVNGSIWQCVGSDSYDALVGSNPVGVVFSEFSLADPTAWDYVRPILAQNGGWALFIYTPRGKNHGYALRNMAQGNPDWFCQTLNVDQTTVISPEIVAQERAAGMSEAMIQQEFYCSFESPNEGAYYGKQMSAAWNEGRITRVAPEPGIDVETWWDLGMNDSMAIWFVQPVGRELRVLHYYENNSEGLAHYANYCKDWAAERDLRYRRHVMPHDIEVRELGTGKSRREVAMSLGLKPVFTAPRLDVEDGREAVRRLLARCWFDERGCERGVSALTEYRKDYDERLKVYRDSHRHDWASHGADAFRTGAIAFREQDKTGGQAGTIQLQKPRFSVFT